MALTGVRVVEMEGIGPGPLCGGMLADFDADVISVSRVTAGKLYWQGDTMSRGKRSVALDTKHPGGMQFMKDLLKKSDVFIESFRPGTMEKMGLGPKEVLELNPRIIYCRMTGWGQGGDPKIEKAAGHDANYLALAGTLDLFKRGNEKPQPPTNFAGDNAGGGVSLFMGILLALEEREKSGKGQVIDAAMTDQSAYVALPLFKQLLNADQGQGMLEKTKYGDLDPTHSRIHQGAPYTECYETKPDPKRPGRVEYMNVQAIEPAFYRDLMKGLGLDKEAGLPEQNDYNSWPMMKMKIGAAFMTKTRDEWAEIFRGMDACAAPVLNAEEAAAHPHNIARGVYGPTPGSPGKFEPNPAPKLSRTPGHTPRPMPTPAADTKQILKEVAGYDDAKINELFASGGVADNSADRGQFDRNLSEPASKL